MKYFILLALLSSLSHAAFIGDVTREGVVTNFDEKTVTLKGDNGKTFKVDRSSIANSYKIESGARVVALMTSDEAVAKLKAQSEAQKKKSKKN